MGKTEKFFGDSALSVLKLFVLDQKLPVEKIDHDNITKILVVIRHQMGDMLCATPMLRSLRKRYPEAHIILVTKSSTRFEEVFRYNYKEMVDEVIRFESGFENFINLVKELREKHISLAVIPSTVVFSATNHLIPYYAHARIRAGVSSFNGYDNKVDYLLNVKNVFLWQTPRVHQIERNLDVIRQLGIAPSEKHILINISKEDKEFASDFCSKNFSGAKNIVGFHPGAAKEGNVWNPEKFAELAYSLHQKFNSEIFISEGPSDAKYVMQMIRILKEKYGIENTARHRGKLMNNMGIINRLSLFITNDTGVMHLAGGLQVPVIALFGPTSAYEWSPLGTNKMAIQSPGLNINDITVNRVFKVSDEILSR